MFAPDTWGTDNCTRWKLKLLFALTARIYNDVYNDCDCLRVNINGEFSSPEVEGSLLQILNCFTILLRRMCSMCTCY